MASADPPNITALKDETYEALMVVWGDHGNDDKMSFKQNDIMDLDVIPEGDLNILLQVVQALLDEKLFKVVHSEGVAWKLRTRDVAKRYRGLTAEQEIVYAHIDEAGSEGAWSKTIKSRTNLHDSVFRAAIKHLETKNMITDMKSVEHPTRKMYILTSLRPSERATGGPWYTDGELDEEFISTVIKVLFDYIRKRTFYESKHGGSPKIPKKVHKKMTVEEIKTARDAGLGGRQEDVDDEATLRLKKYNSMLPMPAGYQGYPNLDELTEFIENAAIFSQVLTKSDIQQLLDIMCYDDRIDRVINGAEGVSYKALRKGLREDDERTSVVTEAPCGRCPVFDLCEEGGPVGPSNCEYFTDWLAM